MSLKKRIFKNKNLTKKAYQDIRKRIFLDGLKPGQKVPYRRMAEGLNMSLTPIVQALKHMEFMGFVRHEQNRGFFVEKVTPDEIDEAYKLRYMLEPAMLTETISKLDKNGEKKIGDALDEYIEACRTGSLKLRIVKDIQFHMIMAELSGQSLSVQMLRHLFDFLYLRFSQELIFSRPSENSVADNTAIYKAIQNRDVKKATRALKEIISVTHKNALEGLQDRLADSEEVIF